MRWRPVIFIAAIAITFATFLSAAAQRGNVDLSDAEVEQLRDTKMEPAQRITVFQKLIDARMERIQRVLVDVRAQGRAEDIHQNMDEISGIVNELEDNIDEYATAHRDLRKPMPKLVSSAERWESILRQPPDNPVYKVTRNLALEAVADVKDQATKLIPEQQQYFKEHPPSKEPPPTQYKVEEPPPNN